jgi:TolB protein
VVAAELDGVAWAPDNSAIVFSSSDGGINRLYRVDLGGGPPQALYDAVTDRYYPAFSPDGQWLAYQKRSRTTPARTALVVSRPGSTAERELAFVTRADASFAAPQWEAGSDQIAYFRSGGGPHAVAFVDLEGRETVVSLAGEDAVNPAWSPDGRHLAYAIADRSIVVDVANPTARTEVPHALADCGVMWAPDATALLGIDGPCSGLFVIPVDDPAAANRIEVPEGEIDVIAWQRTAP